jgi:hypothetical protein
MARSAKTTANEDTATTDAHATDPVAALNPVTRTPRAGSKLAQMVALLEGAEGATIAEIMATTSWQQHTVRGALAGSITKKLGLTLSSEKVEGRGRVYRIGRSPT